MLEIEKPKTCLELNPHLNELELTKRAIYATSEKAMLLDGGSGKKVLIPERLSNYLRRSIDIDVIMPHQEAKMSFHDMAPYNMVDRVRIVRVEGKLNYEELTQYSPFKVYRDEAYPDTDIFTTRTGVGPIQFNDGIFKEAIKVKLAYSNIEVKIADISFTLATSINPLVFTQPRASGALIALLSNLDTFDINDVAARTAEHLSASVSNVNCIMSEILDKNVKSPIRSDKNYKSYGLIISEKLPRRLLMMQTKLERILSKISVKNEEVNYTIKGLNYQLTDVRKMLRS